MTEAAGTFEAVPMEAATPDGRAVVYVSAPSLETVREIVAQRVTDVRLTARIQAVNLAKEIERPFTNERTMEDVIDAARKIEAYLMEGLST